MSDGERWFRHVPFADIAAFEGVGWLWDRAAALLHAPHGCYSVLMEWGGPGEPTEPPREHAQAKIEAPAITLAAE